MASSFEQCSNTLEGSRFSVDYNQDTGIISIPEGDTKTVNKTRKGMISYFTDFIKMQDLMKIEVQIHYQEILGTLG